VGARAFPEDLNPRKIAFKVAINKGIPEIPASVLPAARALITDCCETDPDDRPTFETLIDRLVEMDFKVTEGVNAVKLSKFVKKIEEWERQNIRSEVMPS
jgi:hypothetical protein